MHLPFLTLVKTFFAQKLLKEAKKTYNIGTKKFKKN